MDSRGQSLLIVPTQSPLRLNFRLNSRLVGFDNSIRKWTVELFTAVQAGFRLRCGASGRNIILPALQK